MCPLSILKKCDHSSGCLKFYLFILAVLLFLFVFYYFIFICTYISLACVLSFLTQTLLLCPRLCCIFPTAAIRAAAVVLYPAGSWESHRSNDAENGSPHKGCVQLAEESRLGDSQVSIWRAQKCQCEDHSLGESLRLWCLSVLASNPSSFPECDHGQFTP